MAIQEEERITTFAGLVANAESLADAMIARGLRPQDRVALLLPKSTDAITALFATLMAGAAYVPVEPRSPAETVATLEACQPALVVEPGLQLTAGQANAPPSAGRDRLPALYLRFNGRPQGSCHFA